MILDSIPSRGSPCAKLVKAIWALEFVVKTHERETCKIVCAVCSGKVRRNGQNSSCSCSFSFLVFLVALFISFMYLNIVFWGVVSRLPSEIRACTAEAHRDNYSVIVVNRSAVEIIERLKCTEGVVRSGKSSAVNRDIDGEWSEPQNHQRRNAAERKKYFY